MDGAGLFEDEHDDYRESVRTFLAREAGPGPIQRDLLRAAGAHGFLGMAVPEAHGGAGVEDPRFGVVVGEECMRAGHAALALVLTGHNDVALPALLRGGPDDWLEGLATGELLAAVARAGTPGEASSVVDGLDGLDDGARAGRPREARFVVAGLDADLFVVTEGERVVLYEAAQAEVESSEPPIGLEQAGLATVRFTGAPAADLGDATQLAIDQCLSLAVTAVAGATAALAITVEYVQERKAFGQPIAEFENTRRELATVAAGIDAGAALVEKSIRAQLDGRLDLRHAAAAKVHCSELYGQAVDTGVQLHGGYGYIMEYPIAHAYADARFWRLTGGTNDELRDVVGRALYAPAAANATRASSNAAPASNIG